MTHTRGIIHWALCAAACGLHSTASAQDGAGEEKSSPRHLDRWFSFHHSPWVNLHHILMQETEQRTGPQRRPPRPSPIDPIAWTADERAAWQRAVDYYRANLATRDLLFDQGMVTLRDELALLAAEQALQESATLSAEHARVLTDAAVVYQNREWVRHAAAGRKFEQSLHALAPDFLDDLPECLCERLDTPWPAEPMHVEICVDAGWAGAYTTLRPPLIVISSTDVRLEGALAIETLFHEACHALIGKVSMGIAAECERQQKPMPDTLWHATLFYTAGETVREISGSDYVPYAERFGLYGRRPWDQYRKLLVEYWQPYLDGTVTMQQAIAAMVEQLE